MSTPAKNAADIASIMTWINSVIQNSKLPAELSAQASITDPAESHVIQKGTDDAQEIATSLLRGYQGTWNAQNNTPALADGTGIELDVYFVDTSGQQDLGSGSQNFEIGDLVQYVNGVWYARSSSSISFSLYSGVLTGGAVTINGGDNTKFDVAAGTGFILDWTNPTSPKQVQLTWSEFLAQDIPDIATTFFTTIAIVESATEGIGELQVVSGVVTTPQDRRQSIRLQTVTHLDFATITGVAGSSKPAYEMPEALLDYVTKLGAINNGNQVGESGANLEVDKTSGDTTLPFINRNNNPQSPTTKTNIAQTSVVHSTIYQDGVGGFTITNGITDINPEQWDDGSGTLATVSNNQFTIKRCYFFGDSENLNISYGQAEYASLGLAKSSIFSETPILSPIAQLGTFVTALIVKKGVTDLTAAIASGDAEFVEISSNTSSAGGGVAGNFITQDTDQLTGNTGNKVWDGDHEFKGEVLVKENSSTNGQYEFYSGTVGFNSYIRYNPTAKEYRIVSYDGSFSIVMELHKDYIKFGQLSIANINDGDNQSAVTREFVQGKLSFSAGETIAAGSFVFLSSDGQIYLTNASNENTAKGQIYYSEVGGAGTTVVIRRGDILGLTGLIVGDSYYLAESNGQITNDRSFFVSGSISRYVGTAVSATQLDFNPDATYIEIN
jgi:hypothetical protein